MMVLPVSCSSSCGGCVVVFAVVCVLVFVAVTVLYFVVFWAFISSLFCLIMVVLAGHLYDSVRCACPQFRHFLFCALHS